MVPPRLRIWGQEFRCRGTRALRNPKAGPLTKPYFIRFLGFPEFAAESPFLSANFPIEKRSPSQYACRVPAVRDCGTATQIWVLNLVHKIIKHAHGCFWREADVHKQTASRDG